MLDDTGRLEPTPNWPPYNIERIGDQYRITMAIAGISSDEIELTQHENTLIVVGRRAPEPEGTQVLHHGIATRAFKQSFNLADHVRVTGASLPQRAADRGPRPRGPRGAQAPPHRNRDGRAEERRARQHLPDRPRRQGKQVRLTASSRGETMRGGFPASSLVCAYGGPSGDFVHGRSIWASMLISLGRRRGRERNRNSADICNSL